MSLLRKVEDLQKDANEPVPIEESTSSHATTAVKVWKGKPENALQPLTASTTKFPAETAIDITNSFKPTTTPLSSDLMPSSAALPLMKWAVALRNLCRTQGVLWVTPAVVLNAHRDHRITLPLASTVVTYSDTRAKRTEIMERILLLAAATTTTTTEEPHDSTDSSWSSRILRTASLFTTPVKNTAIMMVSPIRYIADTYLLESSDYSDADQAPSVMVSSSATTATPPWTSPSPPPISSNEQRVPPTEPVVAMDLAVECLQCLVQMVATSAPTIVPVHEWHAWFQQQQQSQRWSPDDADDESTNENNRSTTIRLIARLPVTQLELLLSCLQRLDVLQKLDREGTMSAVYVIGKDPERSVDVRLTLYDLQRNVERVEASIERWRQQADRAGRQARVAASRGVEVTRSLSTAVQTAMARRKLYLKHASTAEGTLLNLLSSIEAVESSVGQRTTLAALQAAADTLKSLRPQLTGTETTVDTIIDDLQDELEHTQLVQDTVAVSLNQEAAFVDDDEVLQELEKLSLMEPDDPLPPGGAAAAESTVVAVSGATLALQRAMSRDASNASTQSTSALHTARSEKQGGLEAV